MWSTTAEACADAFVLIWMACYGVRHTITTDKGSSLGQWCGNQGWDFAHLLIAHLLISLKSNERL